jgi:hypothetical protein
MQDFLLSSGANLQTAFLIYDTIPSIQGKLVSDFVSVISDALAVEESGWQITDDSLLRRPSTKYARLIWGPPQWAEYRWGIGLSSERGNAGSMLFGLMAPSEKLDNRERLIASSKNLNNRELVRAMPDEDRSALASTLESVLPREFGQPILKSEWWPCHISLPNEIANWFQTATLNKIAHSLGKIEEKHLVRGKKMNDFLVDAFIAAKQAMAPVVNSREFKPIPE